MASTRQLAAIMFTDIVGYTSLMGKHAGKALQLIQSSRNIQVPLVQEHDGQWLKEMGDGALAKFSSALDAVQCAIEIQQQARNVLDHKIRIGIHLGDITIDQNDVFGDGVNIASRLEQLADPGGIYISDAILKSIRGQFQVQVEDLGELTLKNVDYPIKTYAVQGPGFPAPDLRRLGKKSQRRHSRGLMLLLILILLGFILAGFWALRDFSGREEVNGLSPDPHLEKSIAVLPFADMSPDKDQQYLGDGLAEEIINVLTEINGLKVIGRTSSFSFKDQNVDLKEIGNQLGAAYILEGSVRKFDDQIRVTTQLINSADGSHLWSTNFNNQLENIFIIQDHIASSIADKFELTLDMSNGLNPPTRNIDAYELFLRGRESYQIGLAGASEAKESLEKALTLDPDFSQAAALLSHVYWQHILYELGERNIYEIKAKDMAQRAIDIGPSSYRGYLAMAWLDVAMDFDWRDAELNLQKAIDRGMPVPFPIHSMMMSIITGSTKEVVQDMKKLLATDPLSVDLLTMLSRYLLFEHQFDKVIENGISTLKLNPDNTSVKRHMAQSYLLLGDYDQAEKAYQELYEYRPNYSPHGYIAALTAQEKTSKAWEILHATKELVSPGKLALSYMYLNELDSTFHYLDKALAEKDFYIALIRIEPHYNRIASDDRYKAIVNKMNFPDRTE